MQETLIKLVEWVESASPELWRIATKQVYVELWQTILGIIVCAVCVGGCMKFAFWCDKKRRGSKYEDETGWMMGQVFSWIGVGVALIILLVLLLELPRYLNMEYITIQKLMQLAP